MKKAVGVTKEIYLLCRELERLENSLTFSVFYSFAEILESHHYCPGFYWDDVYYEVQYDDSDNLRVLNFGERGWREEGLIMENEDIINLTNNLRNEK